jgi:ankyrin repeat protein
VLFLFGQKSDFELISKTNTECPLCHKRDGGLYWATKKATVYLLPIATMQKTYVVGCPHCKEYWNIDQDLGKRLHEQMKDGGKPSARDMGKEIGAIKDLTPARSESETRDDWFKAAHGGDTDALKNLLKRGADINKRDGYGETALLITIEEGNQKTARFLMDKGADINGRDTTFGKTPLLKAIEADQPAIARDLMDKRVDVNLADKNGWTPLLRASEHGQLEVVQALLAHGADVSARSSNGFTPLMQAFVRGHSDIVALLREMGATQ